MKMLKPVGLLPLVVILACAASAWAQEAAPAVKPAKIKVACVGDSITAGGYPAVLNKLIGDGYEVLNLGVSGATLMKHGDFSYWNLGKIEEAEKFGPGIVTIMLGTNDAKPSNYRQHPDEFLGDCKALIETFRTLSSKPKVYVMIPVPVFGNGGYGIDGAVLRKEITPLIVKAAEETKTDTIDLYTLLAESPALFPDNVHPTGDGAEAIAKRISQALTGAPVFESDGRIFLDSMTVRISALGKVEIHYTTDGSEPTAKSPLYKEPLKLTATATIKAITVGDKASPTAQETFSKVTPREPVKPGKTEPGVAYSYYEDKDTMALEDPVKLVPVRSGVMNDFQLAPEKDIREYWGYKWTGCITVPTAGLYTFRTSSDDASRLWIGDTLVVDNGGQHGTVERIGRIALKAGPHPITVTFCNGIMGWSFKTEWEGPGVERQVIPAAALSHEVETK